MNDPFQFLQSIGRSTESSLLILTPLSVLVALAIILALFIIRKRRQDRTMIQNEMKLNRSTEVLPNSKGSGLVANELPEAQQSIANDIEEFKSTSKDDLRKRFLNALGKTRNSLYNALASVFVGGLQFDDQHLEKIHEILFRADVGVKTADRLVAGLKSQLLGRVTEWNMIESCLNTLINDIFSESSKPVNAPQSGPMVVLIVGVNGVGKTTTIGKLAARYKAAGQSVMLAAADTFRAAAIDQLQIWGDRNDVPVIKHVPGADPSAVAFDAVKAAVARKIDILLIDTAGRLHSKTELMAELGKIRKAISKELPTAPHETWIVLDATTGQNAVQQCRAFTEVTPISGIITTKLDGTAKGGVIIGIADQFKIPIRFIGVGEKAADLRPFEPSDFVTGILHSQSV